ncbi:multiple epidermal growth factor-like domains protein 10 [Dreissena polymorpha]|uniref:multiple epidermal growth factor-like domains protein 10 n=1 Tax=Dreissena polymorpha TaxID=45954 RepID=UPI002264D306|nr:multiple epidermal growth factor-like domains protein 10 [Dreissena polymorpha]
MYTLQTITLFLFGFFLHSCKGAGIDYVGCYEDSSSNRILQDYDYFSDSNSPAECSKNCRNYKFFGVQSQRHCLCGNALYSSTQKPESECSFICPGDRSKICGADWRINLYRHSDCPLGSNSVNCSKQCNCRVGSCDNVTGACGNEGCTDGWTGLACNERCALGSYSVNCSKQCHCRVGLCDSVTGACGNGGCKDGWKGIVCNESCPLGSYSVNCSKQCHCLVGPCDGVKGDCENDGCKDGWTGIACNDKCGGVLTDPFGVITSPNYPSNYNSNVQCTWVINASEGYQINVNFTDFALEDSSECDYDFLELFYGPNASSPLVGKFCGTSPPWRFQSQSNSVRIVFSTDSSDSARGFNLTYTFSVQDLFYMGCYEDSKNRILADYDYHSESNSPTECSNNCSHYKFFGVEARTHCLCGNTLHSTTKKPESECSFICSGDRSQICGADWRINIYSHGDCPLGRTGVNCSKRCHCRVNPCDNVTGTCGNGGCKDGWKGMACNESCTLGSYSVNCSKQCHCRVGPCDGVTGACGNDGCTDGWTGIACNEKCGGVLTDPFGVITSPNYPSKYNRKVQCTWDINASEGYQINVNFRDFALEHHSECNYDYLEIFNGPNASFPSFGKFCGTAPPRGFQSQSNSVRIVFYTDSSDSARGFNLTYTFSVQEC